MTVPHPHSDFTAQVHKVHRVEEAGLPAATFLTLLPDGGWSDDLTFADGTIVLCLRDAVHRQVADGLATGAVVRVTGALAHTDAGGALCNYLPCELPTDGRLA
jgi:hypothetical protein